MHTQVGQLIILAITVAVLIGIVWFGYRSHLKEQQRAIEEWARKNDDLNNLMRQATNKPAPSRSMPNFRDIGATNVNDPLSPFSPLNPLNQYPVSGHHECSSRNHWHDPTPACNNDTGSSSYSTGSNND